jgi:hypothetical protein
LRLSLDTSVASASLGRLYGESNVLVGLSSDHEGRDVDHSLADADVSLSNEDTGVVDGRGIVVGKEARLETSVQHLLDRQAQAKLELLLLGRQHAHDGQLLQQGSTFEESLGRLWTGHDRRQNENEVSECVYSRVQGSTE